MQKIGLTLSGGWANGFAHVGALIALEKANIRVDAIAGCSMGSIIGACYAAGKTPLEIEHFILKHRIVDFLELPISKLGISRSGKLKNALNDFMGVKRFSQLKVPLYINATDLSKGEEAVFSSGEIFNAIRASIAIPGVFAPLISKGFYVDGGVLNNSPFSILPKSIRKHIIIDAVPVATLKKDQKPSLAKVLEVSGKLAMKEMLMLRLSKISDNDYVLIMPKMPDYKIMPGKEKILEIIRNGENATREKIPEIKSKLLN